MASPGRYCQIQDSGHICGFRQSNDTIENTTRFNLKCKVQNGDKWPKQVFLGNFALPIEDAQQFCQTLHDTLNELTDESVSKKCYISERIK